MIATLNEHVKALQAQVMELFGQHPDAEICLSQPDMGANLGAWPLANPATTRTAPSRTSRFPVGSSA